MALKITKAILDDVEIVHAIMIQAFEEYRGILNPPSGALSESLESVVNDISDNGGAVIAWENDNPIGSSRYRWLDGFTYIGRVSVLPTHRRRGIAAAMVRFIEDLSRNHQVMDARVEVRLSIPSNINMYKRLGYEVIQHHDYPGKTDSWYTMNKRLLCKNSLPPGSMTNGS